MARKYTEKVEARMIRLIAQDEVLLIRQNTRIKFGTSQEQLGSVFMTNPGSFDFTNSLGWETFKSGLGKDHVFDAEDFPDLTMQNVIEVIRQGYELSGKGKPEGIVNIYNISSIVKAKKDEVIKYHKKAYELLGPDKKYLLAAPEVHDIEKFNSVCNDSKFVVLGFVQNIFTDKVLTLMDWSKRYSEKLVYALDNKGLYSHPRRWRTDKELNNQAIRAMVRVLVNNS